jgi:hypothetical protein
MTTRASWIITLAAQGRRHTVVGPACAATVDMALRLAALSNDLNAELRAAPVVRNFVENKLDPDRIYRRHGSGSPPWAWNLMIEVAHAVLGPWCPTCDGPHDDERHRAARNRERGAS